MEKTWETKKQLGESVSYTSYLKVHELIQLQEPLSSPVAHDELLFIIIHQVYELWFKLINFELLSLTQSLRAGDFITSMRLLKRVGEVLRVLVEQIDILETMSPVEFNRFRSAINPASGFQSFQFREFEMLMGFPIEKLMHLRGAHTEWTDKIQNYVPESSVRSSFFEALVKEGILKEGALEDAVIVALKRVYEDGRYASWHSLCEELIGLDEKIQLWRFRHVQMVERMIGMKKGTGGSLGVKYLVQTLEGRVFPELWKVRTELA